MVIKIIMLTSDNNNYYSYILLNTQEQLYYAMHRILCAPALFKNLKVSTQLFLEKETILFI